MRGTFLEFCLYFAKDCICEDCYCRERVKVRLILEMRLSINLVVQIACFKINFSGHLLQKHLFLNHWEELEALLDFWTQRSLSTQFIRPVSHF